MKSVHTTRTASRRCAPRRLNGEASVTPSGSPSTWRQNWHDRPVPHVRRQFGQQPRESPTLAFIVCGRDATGSATGESTTPLVEVIRRNNRQVSKNLKHHAPVGTTVSTASLMSSAPGERPGGAVAGQL